MRKKAKKKSQFQHAQRRACQRYGLTVGPRKYEELCKKIQQQDCVFLEKQSNRVTMFAVQMEEQWLPVIYDKDRHSIVTFLPKQALDPYLDKLDEKAGKPS